MQNGSAKLVFDIRDAKMCQNFTSVARKVMDSANKIACRYGHEYLGTEHILLALVSESGGSALTILKILNITPSSIRMATLKQILLGMNIYTGTESKMPLTPRAKCALRIAAREAQNLNYDRVETAHLLLGVLGSPGSVSEIVLTHLGLNFNQVKEEANLLANRGIHDDELSEDVTEIERAPKRTTICKIFVFDGGDSKMANSVAEDITAIMENKVLREKPIHLATGGKVQIILYYWE